MNRNRKNQGIFHKFRKNYYEPTIRGIKKYVEPITNFGGIIGEGLYTTKSLLPYSYQHSADLISKALMGVDRTVKVALDVSKAKDYASAIENSKRIIPAVKVGQEIYKGVKQNYLINQAKNTYTPTNDILSIPAFGSRSYEFMRTLGTNDGVVNNAD